MAKVQTGISLPEEIINEIDRVAAGWFSNRSDAIVRIYQEWKQLRQNQLPLVAALMPEADADGQTQPALESINV